MGHYFSLRIAEQLDSKRIKHICYTPIDAHISEIVKNECIVFTGTKDKWLTKDGRNELANYSNIDLIQVENAVHSLEIDDNYKQSIRILEYITDKCYEQYGKNVLKEFNKDPNLARDVKDDKGRIFMIPRLDWCNLSTSMFVNDLFLEKANKEIPTTIDEFYETLVAFKALGDDIIPWGAGQWTSMFQYVFNSFGTSEGTLAYQGKLVYAPYELQEKTKACLEFIAKCYKEKLIDQEYYTLSDDDKLPKIMSGKLGFMNQWEDGSGTYGPGRRHFGLDPIGMFYVMDVKSWAESVHPTTVELIADKEPYITNKKEYPFLTPTNEESIRISEIMTDIGSIRSEMFQKFIVGELDIDQEWDIMIKKWKKWE